jgi:negative regulator of replication initiation
MHRIEVDEETARLIESQGDLLPIEDGYVEVDDEVFAYLLTNALPGENPADTLRRIVRERLTN